MKFATKVLGFKWYILAVLLFAGVAYYFLIYRASTTAVESESFYVIDTVERGEVSSGIETTGEIIAAQKLDLDV